MRPVVTGSEDPETTHYPERFLKPELGVEEKQMLTLFSSCARTSLRTFLVLGLAMVLRKTRFSQENQPPVQTHYKI